MSFRGGGFRGGRGGGGGGFRGGRGGGGGYAPSGPPDSVYEMGTFMHATEGDLVCESVNPKIPYFNAPIYLENKTPIGKVDEILGPLNQVFFTIKPQEGIVATSFKSGDKFFIGGDKLLPIERFLPKPKVLGGVTKSKRGGAGGGRGTAGFVPRGRGRGGPRGGAPRGRGGFGGGSSGGFRGRGGSGGFGSRGASGANRGAVRGGRGRGFGRG